MRILPIGCILRLIVSGVLPVFLTMGCAKEYSYEGKPVPTADTIPKSLDSSVVNTFELPYCHQCTINHGENENTWSLKFNHSYCCGVFTKTVINHERDAFTFFGPSECSVDSGLILNAYFSPVVFDKDLQNIETTRTAFYYFSNNTPATPYIFVGRRSNPITISIDDYSYQTGKATGHYFGQAFMQNGDSVYINSGKFSIVIPR